MTSRVRALAAGSRPGQGGPEEANQVIGWARSLAAAQLHLSVCTVGAAHLSRASAKPGIGSRAQLARALAARGRRPLPPGQRSKFPGFRDSRPRGASLLLGRTETAHGD
jgi:hypothetical protein